MSNPVDFKMMVNMAMSMEGIAHMRPVIEKELLHYDILYALDQDNLLDKLTFQGGTLLRLCYGAPRFSEDLDFAGGREFNSSDLIKIKNCIEKYVANRYQLEVLVKEPKQFAAESQEHGLKVDKWQISITTAPERRDLPKQKIKIEVINVPAYSREPRTMQKNYDFLPDGYSDTFIFCETLEEVYADKIVAFVNCDKYIRYRDIWDLRWLKQQGTEINTQLIKNKIGDYNISDYPDKLGKLLPRLPEIIYSKNFHQQMSRFIPLDVQERTLKKDKFLEFLLNETTALFKQVKMILDDQGSDSKFII